MNRYQWFITIISWLITLTLVFLIYRQNSSLDQTRVLLKTKESILNFYQQLNEGDTFGLQNELDSFFGINELDSNLMVHYKPLTAYLDNYVNVFDSENSTNPDFENAFPADANFSSMQARINAIKGLYSNLLDQNLHLTDSLSKLQGALDEYPPLMEAMTAIQEAKEQMKESLKVNNWKTLSFKSPSGVDVKYIGEVNADDTPDGFGIAIYANGNQYEGQWKNGNKEGQGKFTYQDGELYDGNFVRGKRNGYGIYTWKNGESYSGYWQDDLRSGKGIFTNRRGKVSSSGIWKADKLIKPEELTKDQLRDSKQTESLPQN